MSGLFSSDESGQYVWTEDLYTPVSCSALEVQGRGKMKEIPKKSSPKHDRFCRLAQEISFQINFISIMPSLEEDSCLLILSTQLSVFVLSLILKNHNANDRIKDDLVTIEFEDNLISGLIHLDVGDSGPPGI